MRAIFSLDSLYCSNWIAQARGDAAARRGKRAAIFRLLLLPVRHLEATLSKKNAARVPKKHAKKRTSAVFCFKFTTKQNARCAFSAALCLCTYVATEECALCFFLPPSQERTSVLNCYSWTVGACGGLWKCAEASDIPISLEEPLQLQCTRAVIYYNWSERIC